MITGQPDPDFFAGTWNCTYIWPIVICCGVGGGAGALGGANGMAACSETFATPPMKKLPLIFEDERPAEEAFRRPLRAGGRAERENQYREQGAQPGSVCSVVSVCHRVLGYQYRTSSVPASGQIVQLAESG